MRRYYPGITLFKLIGSILVVLSHLEIFQFMYQPNWYVAASARILTAIVPCFYMIAGFLAYKGWSNAENSYKYVLRYLTWIILIYGLFCFIYIANSTIPQFLAIGLTPHTIINQLRNLFLAVFIIGPYGQLWFIPPLIFGIIASYYFYSKKRLLTAVTLVILGFLLAQLITGTLGILIEVSIGDVFLFHIKHLRILQLLMLEYFGNGFPFILLGIIIGKHEEKFMQINFLKLLFFLVPPIILECVFLNYFVKQYNNNLSLLIFTPIPAGILLFYGVLHTKMRHIKTYHTPINLFTIVIYFSHMLLVYVNLKLLNWQLKTMMPFQMMLFICLTFTEGILITMFIMLLKRNLKSTSKQKILSKA